MPGGGDRVRERSPSASVQSGSTRTGTSSTVLTGVAQTGAVPPAATVIVAVATSLTSAPSLAVKRNVVVPT